MTPLRFTFVLSRYGDDILGGAEKHARDVAEALAARGHDVRALTTCARSYTTWKNELPAGTSALRGVEIERVRVPFGRLRPFDEITKALATRARGVRALGEAWTVCQGPVVPALLDRIEREAPSRDLLVFFSLLSHLTMHGMRRAPQRSALVPLVHEEPPVYLKVARDALTVPRALVVNTEEEWARIRRLADGRQSPGGIVAVGREAPAPPDPSWRPPAGLVAPGLARAPYLLLLGRTGKTRPMVPVIRALARASGLPPLELDGGRTVPWTEVKLVTVGEISPMYARLPNVVQLDWVDDRTRWQLLRNAAAVVNPSVYESLSLVLIEAWSVDRPVVVHPRCDVTVGQCRRSGGGVAIDFDRPETGARQLAEALAPRAARERMGAAGRAYVERRYDWDRVASAYEAIARAVRDGGDVAAALAPWAPVEG